MDLQQRLERFLGAQPKTDRAAFIAPGSIVIGDVTLGADSSVWYGAILRADINSIRIGARSNLQDAVIVHLSDHHSVDIGELVTVGHRAILHACQVGDETLVGMGATILDGARVGKQCIIGANALVKQNMNVPDGSLVYGSPARIVRPLEPAERSGIRAWAEKYIAVARAHQLRLNTAGPGN